MLTVKDNLLLAWAVNINPLSVGDGLASSSQLQNGAILDRIIKLSWLLISEGNVDQKTKQSKANDRD